MLKRNLSYLSVFFLFACGAQENTSDVSIYGGQAFNSDGTSYVNLWRDGGSLPHCSGVLVKPNIVLTAAHCLDTIQAGNILVNGQVRGVDSRFTAWKTPTFPVNEENTFDVGLLKIDGWYDGELPRVPHKNERFNLAQERLTLHASGTFEENKYSSKLLKGDMQYRMDWGYYGLEFVAGSSDTHVCKGNSGGGLMAVDRNVVIGVASRKFSHDRFSNCDANTAGIFTDLRSETVINWVNNNIAALEESN